MKHLFFILFIFIIIHSKSFSAGTDPLCSAPAGGAINLSQVGGIYLSAQGTIKVLVVFVSFKNDNSYHPYWPVGQPPQNYNTFVDPNLSTGSTHYINLTNYFNKTSLGVYKVIGQAVYVEAPNTKSYYGSNRYLANKEVLQQKVDPLVNFADFDNWSSSANYTHSNQPDGTIDMIIMIWRTSTLSWFFSSDWSGEASLGYGTSYTVEGGTKTIKTGYSLNSGSGVTVHFWGERTPERNFKVAVHEVGHWLLGGSHPYGDGNDKHKLWGILTLADEGICANTYERERLAWINPTPITSDVLNAPFQDYVEYGTAYKYHPSNGATNEYYYFENHQKLSIYDNITLNVNDKGIFVLHQQGVYNGTNNIRVKTSNGQWDWVHTGTATCFEGVSVPKFKPTGVNRSGRNNKDVLLKTDGSSEFLFYLDGWTTGTWPSGGCGGWLLGEGLNNSFDLAYNDVFSNYSNPWARRWTNDATNNFTMEIIAQNGSVVNSRFYITNPLDGKPSKPQNLQVSVNQYDEAVLTWEANIEDDIISGGKYKIDCADVYGTGEPTGWDYTTTIDAYNGSTPVTTWTDGGSYIYSGPRWLHYQISAIDNTNKESVPSDKVKINGKIPKRSTGEQNNIVNSYELLQNHPNPFNPATTIQYDVKEKGLVSLAVYDLLGREMASLVNENKEEGSYSFSFDAGNLPSGVYIYTLRVNDFTASNKMIVLK